jgi:hypothetical protein
MSMGIRADAVGAPAMPRSPVAKGRARGESRGTRRISVLKKVIAAAAATLAVGLVLGSGLSQTAAVAATTPTSRHHRPYVCVVHRHPRVLGVCWTGQRHVVRRHRPYVCVVYRHPRVLGVC